MFKWSSIVIICQIFIMTRESGYTIQLQTNWNATFFFVSVSYICKDAYLVLIG